MAKLKNEIADYDNPIAEVDVLQMDYFIGELMRHCELLGLTDRQLMANKTALRNLTWKWYNSLLPNPSGLADASKQAREHHKIDIPGWITAFDGKSHPVDTSYSITT